MSTSQKIRMLKSYAFAIMIIFLFTPLRCLNQPGEEGIHNLNPVPFTKVTIEDEFWVPRMDTNRKVTIPYEFKKCEETGRVSNFAKAGGLVKGEHQGEPFNDSDVFKIIEGAAYSLSTHPDPELERYLDDLIAKIVAAQEDDGYLYTARTANSKELINWIGKQRWSNLVSSHELYNLGHLYEAAVAHYLATGKRTLLNVAIKSANLIDSVFGPDKKCNPPGHQEIEIGLVKLYRVTHNEKYLKLAKFFLDERGRIHHGRKLYGAYAQDHKPITQQSEAVGHAVRACYMYSAMADVAALTGNSDYLRALDQIWENVVSKKLYITGGIGAHSANEGFGASYELPNATAYCETCAAIANALWNYRLFLLWGDAKYIDVLERIIYNGFLSGVSFQGINFFYANPLKSKGNYSRSPWFGCACCPTNIVRFMPRIPGYIYAYQNDNLYINLFIQGKGTVELEKNTVLLKQETLYPWDGKVKITVEPEHSSEFTIYLRIPCWALGQPVPGDLYQYMNKIEGEVKLKVNDKPLPLDIEKGFARIRRKWKKGDVIYLNLPMLIHRVLANKKVKDDVGKVALQRGPIVYCVEGIDNDGHALNLLLEDDKKLHTEYRKNLLNGVVVICGEAFGFHPSEDGKSVVKKVQEFTAIPYYAWSNRGASEMAVWLWHDLSKASIDFINIQ